MPIPSRLLNLQKKTNMQTVYSVTFKIFQMDWLQEWIITTIQTRLKRQGTDYKGGKLRTSTAFLQRQNFYSLFTQEIKRISESQHVTLEDSGKFYDSMDVVINKTTAKLIADFNKPKGHIQFNFTNQYKTEKEFETAIMNLSNSDRAVFLNDIFLPEFISFFLYEILQK
jgi:hypothetical protein